MLNNYSEAVSGAERRLSVGVVIQNAALFLLNFKRLILPKYRKTEYQAESYIYLRGGGSPSNTTSTSTLRSGPVT